MNGRLWNVFFINTLSSSISRLGCCLVESLMLVCLLSVLQCSTYQEIIRFPKCKTGSFIQVVVADSEDFLNGWLFQCIFLRNWLLYCNHYTLFPPVINHSLLMVPNHHFYFDQNLSWDLDTDSGTLLIECGEGASVNLEQCPYSFPPFSIIIYNRNVLISGVTQTI